MRHLTRNTSGVNFLSKVQHGILFLEAASHHFELNLSTTTKKVKKGQIHHLLIF